ncbi:pyridoxamine 5'-phosphate oxidase family protein [Ornithinimicrobium cavernae]|uniref:pyridoxamine 5'-phosphate oxidase family protein n=1 Tax=Ornithinimicrobium cavernae TaxID=2666047 RepID=UPI000D69C2B0|nr:pyridoxamine 5'-phosphate oxidase family protein [Ornithinimicrobium cavernae]
MLPPTSLTRLSERGTSDRVTLDALLDDVMVGTLSTVAEGMPWSVPLFIARDGDRIVLHGSTGGGILRHLVEGAPVTLTVFALDAIVVAHTAFDSSANYRSAVLRGTVTRLEGQEAEDALHVVTERLIPGRTAEVRASTRREYAATVVLALPIEDGMWILKARSGPAGEPDEPTDAWAGIVSLRTVADTPSADEWVDPKTLVPASVEGLRDRYQ